jgi:hypothetical protein
MIIQLIKMNISSRKYPVKGKVPESPDCLLSLGSGILVSDLNRCSRTKSVQVDDRSEELAPGCRGSSRTGDVEEVVVQERAVAWRRSPKTLSPAYPEQDLSSRTRFRRLCSRWYHVCGASDGNAKRSSKTEEKRERSPEQEYLSVNWQSEQEEEGDLYRRAGARGMNLDVMVNAPQEVTVAVRSQLRLNNCRGLRCR